MKRTQPGSQIMEAASRTLLLLASGVALAGCGGGAPATPTAPYNEHQWVEETRTLAPVHGVVLSMPANLRIEQGPDQRLWLNGEMILLPSILTRVHNGILEISLEAAYPQHPGRLTEILLTTPTLDSAELTDDGSITCSGLEVERLSLRLAVAGELEFSDLTASRLEVTTGSNPGTVRVSGRVESQEIELSGLADFEARDLDSARARVTLSRAGSATVRIDELLTVTIRGSGSVYYLGDPDIHSTITGTGRVVSLGD